MQLIPLLGKVLFPSVVWNIPSSTPCLYLTFDDGPVPEATPFVLDTLKQYQAKATFFCVGENVKKHPAIFKRILEEGHAVGNHTYNHLNGWKTANDIYNDNIDQAATVISSTLFRPPYGKLKPSQYSLVNKHYSIVMWDVLSKDYDRQLSGEQCVERVLRKSKPGSIVVFHDSAKAVERLQYALPILLEHYANKEYAFKKILL